MKPITLKEIGQKLGISVATVSKALKDYPDVNSNTKQRVKSLAEELNYFPNTAALSLRKKQTKTIGLIIPTVVHYFFSNVIKGILSIAEEHNYLVIILQSDENSLLEKKQIDLLIGKNVDGVIISLATLTRNFSHLKKLKDYNIPFVQFDRISKLIESPKVIVDDRQASYDAVTYLINKGHKRIANFRGNLNPQNSIDRFLGYKQALIDNNIQFDPSLVYLCDSNSDFEDGMAKAQKLIEDHGTSVDAVFAITDLMAIGAINYFKNNNIKIPEDIAVFGFSNWYMSSVITPKLSTVNQDGYKMGQESIKLLLSDIKNKYAGIPSPPKTVLVNTELVIRDSA